MKRSTNITLVLLTAVAAAACDEQNEIKHCVNEDGVVQEEEKCKDAPVTVPTGSDGGVAHGSGGGGGHFFWYYGGGGGSRTPVAPGGRVSGGSYSPSSGKTYAPSSGFSGGGGSKGGSVGGGSHGGGNSPSVGRGGFGATGGGHAGGGGGSGG